ncbi:polysaccharide deacetylase family protein [Fundidesulfovibrio agrisoli]|uniref:polysaccharide deacetylase family protein n=1 Tax=Fundidesulfovibrio agrisoli TaxID=2922717 RepID=UPI001FAC170F|nr:polysaccharide deacetylase family protein [Fundidesulfovibrio agrisoli]
MNLVRLVYLTVLIVLMATATSWSQELKKVLIVYDGTGSRAWSGELSTIQLKNILSHFNAEVVSHPVDAYTANESLAYDVVFYLGTTFNAALSQSFIGDLLNTDTKIFWINYNLHKVSWGNTQEQFKNKFGLSYVKTVNTLEWASVEYKGTWLPRAGGDLAVVTLETRADTEVLALAKSVNETAPYILRSKNLYFIADNPFENVSYADRALAFCDILHDVLESGVAESHQAVLRIEDVHTHQDPTQLRAIADYLYSRRVPFAISLIPQYEDPRHVYGAPYSSTWSEAPEALAAVQYMIKRGGRIVMHGYTHQYSSIKNPDSGVTAEDWEFYRVARRTDGSERYVGFIPEDSEQWVTDRITMGLSLLKKSNLSPVAWLTPHYLASPMDYSVFARYFPLALDRGVYFAQDSNGNYQFREQYAPYPMERDAYGTKRLPETCNYISPYEIPPRLPADAVGLARLVKVVRDGWAGCYFHPFLDISYLKEMVEGIQAEGYTFVAVGKAPPVAPVGGISTLLLTAQ